MKKNRSPLSPLRSGSLPSSRPPLARMMQMHAAIKAGRFPNCRKLAEELEVSAKTIQRDIDFMRYQLNLPIEYDGQRFGFHYTAPVAAFPNVDITEGELVALYVGQKALTQFKGTPFERPLSSAFRKISGSLRDTMSFSWDQLESAVSFHSVGASVADATVFHAISQAVLAQREIAFDYKKLGTRAFERRRVRPYHLAAVEHLWYLFAFDIKRGEVRTFALPRLRKLQVSQFTFTKPRDFTIARYLQRSFGVHSSKPEVHTVRIAFDEFAAQLIEERDWHASQRIRRRHNGIELTLELGSLEEIARWILSWGGHAKVLSPRSLVELVREEAAKVANSYVRR